MYGVIIMKKLFFTAAAVSCAVSMLFNACALAQGRSENLEKNVERARPVSSLKVTSNAGRISVESSAGVERNGEFTGVRSSLSVDGGASGIAAGSSLELVRGGETRKGVSSSLDVEGGPARIDAESRFETTGGYGTREVTSSLSAAPPEGSSSGIGRINSTFSRNGFGGAGIFRRTPPEVLKKILQYKKIADEMIAKEPASDVWWSSYGFCTDLSGKWLPELQKRGMKAALSATDSNATPAFVICDGKEKQIFKFHVFLADRSLGTDENEIIFDPSYMQFIEGADKLAGLPKIFIGTRHDAEKLYARFRERCRVEAGDGGDPLTGSYEIKSFTELTYSYGRNAAARQTFE